MRFTSKNIQSRKNSMGFLKWATLFFLWLSWVLFVTTAFNIVPIAPNAIQYIKTIFLTNDGGNTSATGIILDGSLTWGITITNLTGRVVLWTDVDGKISSSTAQNIYNYISGLIPGYWSRNNTSGYVYLTTWSDRVGIWTNSPTVALQVSGNFIAWNINNFISGVDSTIAWGSNNNINSSWSFIWWWTWNIIYTKAINSFVGGGQDNKIWTWVLIMWRLKWGYGFIWWWWNNVIDMTVWKSVIVGWINNAIQTWSDISAIVWWTWNIIKWTRSFVWGGGANVIIWDNSVIWGWWEPTMYINIANFCDHPLANCNDNIYEWPNTINGNYWFIGWWTYNHIRDGIVSSIVGWSDNSIFWSFSSIGWWVHNHITWGLSVIPGGSQNNISWNWSVAMGKKSIVNHDNTFVWNDATYDIDPTFESIKSNTFLVHAANGVGINTNDPTTTLDISGDLKIRSVWQDNSLTQILAIDSNGLVNRVDGNNFGGNGWVWISYWSRNNTSGYVYLTTWSDSVGIGITDPTQPLQVIGNILWWDISNSIVGTLSSVVWWSGNNINGSGSSIVWGQLNKILSDNLSFIWWGKLNTIQNKWGKYNSIIWGWSNNITGTNDIFASIIGWWLSNTIYDSNYGFIWWGSGNRILGADPSKDYANIIMWGSDNTIKKVKNYVKNSTIAWWYGNKIMDDNGIDSSFVAGYQAIAMNTNTFVRNSDTTTAFSSSRSNAFLINVPYDDKTNKGWVGINTPNPKAALDVNGSIVSNGNITVSNSITALDIFAPTIVGDVVMGNIIGTSFSANGVPGIDKIIDVNGVLGPCTMKFTQWLLTAATWAGCPL